MAAKNIISNILKERKNMNKDQLTKELIESNKNLKRFYSIISLSANTSSKFKSPDFATSLAN